jgi:hypothetical protein
MLHEADGGAGRDFTLVFGGWSAEAGCFRTYRISSGVRRIERPAGDEDAAQSATQSAAWQVDEIEGLWCAPWPGLKVASECGVDSLNGDVDRSISVAEKLIVAARRQRSPLVGATGEHYWVGGFLQLTVIKRDFAQSWISRRWPDRLGEPITPLPEEPEQRSGVERAPGRTRRRHLASLATRPTTVRYD